MTIFDLAFAVGALYESFAARGIEFDIEDERLGQARAMPTAS